MEKVKGGIDGIFAMTYGDLLEKRKEKPYIKIVFKEKEARRRTLPDEPYLTGYDLAQYFSLTKDEDGKIIFYAGYRGDVCGLMPDPRRLSVFVSNIKEVFFISADES